MQHCSGFIVSISRPGTSIRYQHFSRNWTRTALCQAFGLPWHAGSSHLLGARVWATVRGCRAVRPSRAPESPSSVASVGSFKAISRSQCADEPKKNRLKTVAKLPLLLHVELSVALCRACRAGMHVTSGLHRHIDLFVAALWPGMCVCVCEPGEENGAFVRGRRSDCLI